VFLYRQSVNTSSLEPPSPPRDGGSANIGHEQRLLEAPWIIAVDAQTATGLKTRLLASCQGLVKWGISFDRELWPSWSRFGAFLAAEVGEIRCWIIEVHPVTPLVEPAFDIALATGRTVCDSIYLALAVALGCRLVTADLKH
jgi:hypothetical protein